MLPRNGPRWNAFSIRRARWAALEPFHLPAKNGYLVIELFLRQMQSGNDSEAGG